MHRNNTNSDSRWVFCFLFHFWIQFPILSFFFFLKTVLSTFKYNSDKRIKMGDMQEGWRQILCPQSSLPNTHGGQNEKKKEIGSKCTILWVIENAVKENDYITYTLIMTTKTTILVVLQNWTFSLKKRKANKQTEIQIVCCKAYMCQLLKQIDTKMWHKQRLTERQ